jgi:hypothetical protein
MPEFGITIDEKFKFQIHINNQTQKANQRLGMIKRSFTKIKNVQSREISNIGYTIRHMTMTNKAK